MKKIFSTFFVLVALLAMTTGAAFAGSALELVEVRNDEGVPTFVFRVTGEFSKETGRRFVKVGGENFPLYCAQQDEDTVVCHTSKAAAGNDVVVGFGGASFWDRVPERTAETSAFLSGHAAIQPHIAVTNHKHHYSFSAQATDIVFHSPEFVAPGPSRLSDFVVAEIRRRQGEERWTSIDELAASRAQLAREFGIDEPQGETATERLRAFGRALHQQHQIRQVLLLRRAERGNKQ